jgi:hypothetical protein
MSRLAHEISIKTSRWHGVYEMSRHPLGQPSPRGWFAAMAERLFRRKNHG